MNVLGKRSVLSAFGVLALALALPAQATMGVTAGVLTAGGDATITYSDPGQAGELVVVEIDNGDLDNPLTDVVVIQLDGNGNGSALWRVPLSGWDLANFNNPEVETVTRPIEGVGPPVGG